ncbi:hypothetical protein [Clostridium sp.]|uniref:hypothetical protein n=1 Tax=Clostridium sp. TaxID=1506 RepID=UPI00262E4E67|nr:hypothetical protein [Clostridium sp.]
MQYKVKRFLIVMNDFDEFIISIKQDINRPNNPDNDQLIEGYMNENYYGHSYDAIDLDNLELLYTAII